MLLFVTGCHQEKPFHTLEKVMSYEKEKSFVTVIK
jgi:hypothetical protein